MSIKLYENVGRGVQEDRDPFDVPEFFRNYRQPQRMSVGQADVIVEIASEENPQAIIDQLREDGYLGNRDNLLDVVNAFMTWRNEGVKASFRTLARLRSLSVALEEAEGVKNMARINRAVERADAALESEDVTAVNKAMVECEGLVRAYQRQPDITILWVENPNEEQVQEVPTHEEPPLIEKPEVI